MIIERKEIWGKIRYDTLRHSFSYVQTEEKDAVPYADRPVTLNVDLTMNCNMDCLHCVAKDFDNPEDLVVSRELLQWINKSDFMVVVITGGEPLLPNYEKELLTLIQGIHGKGLIVDTNGTIFPRRTVIDAFLKTNTLVRISWDSIRPQDETYFRRVRSDTKPDEKINYEYYLRKRDILRGLQDAGVEVAIQTVVHKKNLGSIKGMPAKLREFSIKQWYLQRFIPSHSVANKKYELSDEKYDKVIAQLTRKCREEKIECFAKKDRRHNCVFLLVGKGLLYTQGEEPRQKILIGSIDDPEIRYFEYVSSADHAERYYGLVPPADS